MKKNEAIRNAKNFDEILNIEYGKIGTKKRDEFEKKAQYFVISETLKAARHEANMTQEQLADKAGTKKSYISRLENGKCDIHCQRYTGYLKMAPAGGLACLSVDAALKNGLFQMYNSQSKINFNSFNERSSNTSHRNNKAGSAPAYGHG